MYNIAKLLTEEPEKLERLIILLLKFLICLWVPCYIFDIDIRLNFEDISNGKTFSEYSIASIIYFVSIFIVSWFVLWKIGELIAIGVIYLISLIIKLLSKLVSKWFTTVDFFKTILIILNVVDSDGYPKQNIVAFSESLEELEKSEVNIFDEASSRTNQYLFIGTVIFLVLILSKDISLDPTLNVVIIVILCLSLINSALINLTGKYIYSKLPKLIMGVKQASHYYHVKSALADKMKFPYNAEYKRKRIVLTKQEDYMPSPRIEFIPIYFWNLNLGDKMLADNLVKKNEFEGYRVIISNIKSDSLEKIVSKTNNVIYIFGETNEEIKNRIDELFYIIDNKHPYTDEHFEKLNKSEGEIFLKNNSNNDKK